MANWMGVWRTNYVKLREDRMKDLSYFLVELLPKGQLLSYSIAAA